MRKSAVIALLLSTTTAIQRHHHHHRRGGPAAHAYFATGMNGDEDLGQDITMKGEKFHYQQQENLIQIQDNIQHIRNWLVQNGQREDNLDHIAGEGKLQSTAGPETLGHPSIGEGVHTLIMNRGTNYPDENRDRLKDTNNMWSYPEKLGPGNIKAHIPEKPSESKDDAAEVGASKLQNAAKKAAQAAKQAAGEAKANDAAEAKAESLAQQREINSTPEKLQAVGNTPDIGADHIGESVHTAAMWAGDRFPALERDRLKNTNNMWSYPEHLQKHGPVQAHIDQSTPITQAKDAEMGSKSVESAAKAAAKVASELGKKAAEANGQAAKAGGDPVTVPNEPALAQIRWNETPKEGDRDYVTANMWAYPRHQTPDPHAAAGAASADDMADAEAARAASKVKAEAAAAEADKKRAAEQATADIKKSVVEGKAKAAKEEAAEKAKEAAALKSADAKTPAAAKEAAAAAAPASFAQKKAHDDLIDHDFKPHGIYEDPIHNDRMNKIASVAAPWDTDGHMSESVWRSAVEGGEPHPDKSRSLIGNFPMFNYPVHNDAPQAPHALQAEDAPAVAVDKAKVEAAKARAATEAAADAKEEANAAAAAGKKASLAQKKGDVLATGSMDYGAHAVLDDTLHQDRKQKIQSVAGPEVTDQIGASVHASAMEGGDANPGDNRTIIGNNPSSFIPQYGVSTTKSAADIASAESLAKGQAINAANSAAAAKEAAIQADVKAKQDAKLAVEKAELAASDPKTVKGKEAKDAKMKALDEKLDAVADEQKAKSAEAIANADTKKDKDVTLLKIKK